VFIKHIFLLSFINVISLLAGAVLFHINNEIRFLIENCTFLRCVSAIEGASSSSSGDGGFAIKDSSFDECLGEGRYSIYFDATIEGSLNYEFNNITYNSITSDTVFYMKINDLSAVITEASSFTTFRNNFIGFCGNPVNETSFVLKNGSDGGEYPLTYIICSHPIYVSNNGSDFPSCGKKELPCQTIFYGYGLLGNIDDYAITDRKIFVIGTTDGKYLLNEVSAPNKATITCSEETTPSEIVISDKAWGLDVKIIETSGEWDLILSYLNIELPGSLTASNLIGHSSSGVLTMMELNIKGGAEPTSSVAGSLIHSMTGNVNIKNCGFENIKLVNKNGSVINCIVPSDKQLKIESFIYPFIILFYFFVI
jgi:hypothetical protein